MGYIMLRDETLFGELIGERSIAVTGTATTLRQLISERVRREVARLNSPDGKAKRPLVQPIAKELRLNGAPTQRTSSPVKEDAAVAAAIAGFESNAFFVLVGDRQVEDLDAPLPLAEVTSVCFVKLTQLVGG